MILSSFYMHHNIALKRLSQISLMNQIHLIKCPYSLTTLLLFENKYLLNNQVQRPVATLRDTFKETSRNKRRVWLWNGPVRNVPSLGVDNIYRPLYYA